MKCLLIVALATLQVISGEKNLACEDGWSLYKAENKCIRAFGKETKSWPGAETACEKEGGRIVTIRDKETQAFINKLFEDDDTAYWIGLTRSSNGRYWEWQNGAKLGDYHAWAKGEPNNDYCSENCVERLSSGSWNDAKCTDKNNYICEREVEEDLPCSGDGWSFYEAENKSIRAFGNETKSWLDGELACRKEGGGLVTIHDKEAQAFVNRLLRHDDHTHWIGLTHSPIRMNWEWRDGSKLGDYHAWAKGEPNNAGSHEYCVEMLSSGSWNDVECANKKTYICEREGPICEYNNGGCSADAICVGSADGGWHVTCRCHHGYALQDGHCYDVDECSFENGGCEDICTNKKGSCVCSCREGYTADGNTCNQDTIIG